MKQKTDSRRAPTARDVIKSGSFLAPMHKWVTLAAAVSQPRFDEHMAAFKEWIEGEFRRFRVQPGNYDELARKLAPLSLTCWENESAMDYCQRVLLLRRPATDNPLEEAFKRPGRPRRKS